MSCTFKRILSVFYVKFSFTFTDLLAYYNQQISETLFIVYSNCIYIHIGNI